MTLQPTTPGSDTPSPHAALPSESEVRPPVSRLATVLAAGGFAVTAELDSPDSADPQAVVDAAAPLASVCDAINVTDASGANTHISSVAACAILVRAGLEPVFQVGCRDRNRIAIQGDLLGAAALGIRNVLCLTGDGAQAGDQPESKMVFDLDSVSLLRTALILRDRSRLLSGRPLKAAPTLFLGAAANPFVPPFEFRARHLEKKVRAGAQFIQTQYCFDVPRFRSFMTRVRDLGLDERVAILVGVGPLRSPKVAEWMRSNVPGVHIPDAVIRRMKGVPQDRQRAEGMQVCVDIIREVMQIPGVRGVHLMAYRQEKLVPEILEASGVSDRRRASESASEQATSTAAAGTPAAPTTN
jgi:methylenetetrahydrofolate reductase (NADPH)